jgi:hypothetical protein
MAVPAIVLQGADEAFERERRRYNKVLEAEDQRLWGPDEIMRKAYDITYGMKPKGEKTFDLPPGIIKNAHISTAMQGSIFPGKVDPKVRSIGVFSRGQPVSRNPFTTKGVPLPKGMGDMNTDELLQKALREHLTKGELQKRSALEFSSDRPWRGR